MIRVALSILVSLVASPDFGNRGNRLSLEAITVPEIVGHVTDVAGNPVGGCVVTLEVQGRRDPDLGRVFPPELISYSTVGRCVTDSLGRYTIKTERVRRGDVVANSTLYVVARKPSILLKGVVDIRLVKAAPLKCKVVDEKNNRPLARARVFAAHRSSAARSGGDVEIATNASAWYWNATLRSGMDGACVFRRAPLGKLYFYVLADDFELLEGYTVVVIPGMEKVPVIALTRGLTLRCIVSRAKSGAPVHEVVVGISSASSSRPLYKLRSNDKGVFIVRGASPETLAFEFLEKGQGRAKRVIRTIARRDGFDSRRCNYLRFLLE